MSPLTSNSSCVPITLVSGRIIGWLMLVVRNNGHLHEYRSRVIIFFPEKNWMILFFKFNLFAFDEMKLFIFHDLNACGSCRPSQLHLQPRHSFYFFAFKPWARDRERKMIAKLPYTIISITNVKAESSQHTFLLSNAILLKLQYFILIFLYFHADTLFFYVENVCSALKL